MSALAYNLNGDPFELPPTAVGYRVKRLKSKGPPELIYGADGLPLTVPLDADIDDLRRELRSADGRYRLDPIDEHGRAIASSQAAYVVVHGPEQPSEPTVAGGGRVSTDAVIEAMRMNSELARTIIERFPSMVESVAGLIRAADGAGLPARQPRPAVLVLRKDDDDEDGEEDEADEQDEEDDPKEPTTWLGMAERAWPHVEPWISAALASGKVKLPGGARGSHERRDQDAVDAHAARTPGAVPAPGPSDPAPARRQRPEETDPGASSPRAATAGGQKAAVGHALAPQAPNPGAHLTPDPMLATTSRNVGALPADLPTLDFAALARLAAIREGLTLQEQMLAQELIAKLSPSERRAFVADLQALSIPEAIAEVRAVLGLEQGDLGPSEPALQPENGGVS